MFLFENLLKYQRVESRCELFGKKEDGDVRIKTSKCKRIEWNIAADKFKVKTRFFRVNGCSNIHSEIKYHIKKEKPTSRCGQLRRVVAK